MRCMELPKELEDLRKLYTPYLITAPNGFERILKPGTPKHIVEAREKFLKLNLEHRVHEIMYGI